jgi:hypothetical protein
LIQAFPVTCLPFPPPLYVAACSADDNISLSSKESGEPHASLW